MSDRPVLEARRSSRRATYLNVLEYLEYRIVLCREAMEQAEAKDGPTSPGAATERSALFEVELIKREIGKMAVRPVRDREMRQAAEKRNSYVKQRAAAGRSRLNPDDRSAS